MGEQMSNLMRLVAFPGTFGETCEFILMPTGGLSIAPCGADLLPDEERRIQLDPDQVKHLMARLNTDPVEAQRVAESLLRDHFNNRLSAYHGLSPRVGYYIGVITGLAVGWLLF
jgi:hypothetical protein